MKRLNKNSGLWQYLKEKGLLDASDEERKEARKAYRKLYLKNYKANHKAYALQYGISFKKDEADVIEKAAANHRMKPSRYVREAALAYTNQVFLLLHSEEIYQILQLLRRYQTVIEDRERKAEKSWFGADRKYRELANAIEEIREQIDDAMRRPELLIDAIRISIENNSKFKSELIELLQKV